MLSDPYRRSFLLLNAIGGIAVLGSYGWGAIAVPDTMGSLWGGVPVGIRPLYTVNMLLSAAGYFLFAPYVALKLDTARNDYAGRFGYSIFQRLFGLVLFPSALWLPLTYWMLADPSALVWALVRIDLFLVGFGSVALFVVLLRLRDPYPRGRVAALIGLVPFCLQTAVLDAIIWPIFFNQ